MFLVCFTARFCLLLLFAAYRTPDLAVVRTVFGWLRWKFCFIYDFRFHRVLSGLVRFQLHGITGPAACSGGFVNLWVQWSSAVNQKLQAQHLFQMPVQSVVRVKIEYVCPCWYFGCRPHVLHDKSYRGCRTLSCGILAFLQIWMLVMFCQRTILEHIFHNLEQSRWVVASNTWVNSHTWVHSHTVWATAGVLWITFLNLLGILLAFGRMSCLVVGHDSCHGDEFGYSSCADVGLCRTFTYPSIKVDATKDLASPPSKQKRSCSEHYRWVSSECSSEQ